MYSCNCSKNVKVSSRLQKNCCLKSVQKSLVLVKIKDLKKLAKFEKKLREEKNYIESFCF